MLGHHRPASEVPFKWRFAGGLMMTHLKWYLDPLFPHQLKKRSQSRTPSEKTFWIRACTGGRKDLPREAIGLKVFRTRIS